MFGLIDKIFGGGGDKSVPEPQKSDFQNQVEGYISDNLKNGAAQYQGPTTIEMPEIYGELSGVVSNYLNGENLGMSDDEMSKYMGQVNKNLNEQRQKGIESIISGMNSRGLLASSNTRGGLNDVSRNYADSLADAQTNMYLQNEQMKRSQMNNAIGYGMNLGQWQSNVDQQNVSNQMNNFYNQQQLNQQPLQMAMNYLGGVEMPFQEMKYQTQVGNANREQQADSSFLGTIGTIAGGYLAGL